MARPKALIYLSRNLGRPLPGGVTTDFAREWKGLSNEDKATLKKWADEEMDELGL